MEIVLVVPEIGNSSANREKRTLCHSEIFKLKGAKKTIGNIARNHTLKGKNRGQA